MVFEFQADCRIEAENIDEAMALLAAHFQSLSEGGDSVLDFEGTFEIRPV